MDTSPLNIHAKILSISFDLAQLNLKKTGKVTFANKGFDYFRLEDYQNALLSLMKKYNVYSYFNFLPQEAVLTVVNIDKPEEQLNYRICYDGLSLKDTGLTYANQLKELGSKTTYFRRYLLNIAFSINDEDFVDIENSDMGTAVRKEKQLAVRKEKQLAPTNFNDRLKKDLSSLLNKNGIFSNMQLAFLKKYFTKELDNNNYLKIIADLNNNNNLFIEWKHGS